MQPIPIILPVGPAYRMVTRAWLDGNTVHGELDFPPDLPLSLADHFPPPNKPILPGVMKMSLIFQAVTTLCATVSNGRLFPILTGIPLVRFQSLTKPGEVALKAGIFQDGVGGVATCNVSVNGKPHASAIFTFELSEDGPREALLPLPLEQVEVVPTAPEGSISGIFRYRGDEVLPLDKLEEIPWPLILEALGQNAIQIRHDNPALENALFVVTYLRKVVFRNVARLGTLKLCTQVEWTANKRGLVHAVASNGDGLVVDGDFGFAILSPRRV